MHKYIWQISVMIILILIGASTYFIHKGFENHVLALSIKRWSEQKWNEGKYIESVKWFINSYESAFDAGVRWTIVEEFYFGRVNDLRNQGKLDKALEVCSQAEKILGGTDDEGTTGYKCVEIQQQIINQK